MSCNSLPDIVPNSTVRDNLQASPANTEAVGDLSQLVHASAVAYGQRGWRVVPLHGILTDATGNRRCTCRKWQTCGTSSGKHPRQLAWQNVATDDQATVAQWFEQWPGANVGVVLGPSSGIMDFETDSAEEEQILLELFGGDIPMTVSFTSGRGKHRLFKYHPDLPGKAVHAIGALKIKIGAAGRGTQSVFPPSLHLSGRRYEWVPGLGPDEM